MTKQTIEVEVPEGWRVKEYRMPNKGDYFWHQNRVCVASSSFIDQRLIIEKIQPRRIVLVETDEFRIPRQGEYFRRGMVDSPIEVCLKMEVCAVKIWRIKEER